MFPPDRTKCKEQRHSFAILMTNGLRMSLFVPFSFLCMVRFAFGEDVDLVRVALHVHSQFSGGENTIEEIAELALEANIDALVLTDHALLRLEYGLPLYRHLIQGAYEKSSVLQIGPSHYLEEIARVQEQYPELVIIPGVEVAPFYRWSIDWVERRVHLHGWRQHIIIAGLYNKDDYESLPLWGNPFDDRPPKMVTVITLVTLAFVIVFLVDALVQKRLRSLLAACCLLTLLKLADSAFTGNVVHSPYKGEKGITPYQEIIEYADQRGALTFWAHPVGPGFAFLPPLMGGRIKSRIETNALTQLYIPLGGYNLASFYIHSPSYEKDLLYAQDYTGFATQTFVDLVKPESVWDAALQDYCEGKRRQPVWVEGELDYHRGGDLNKRTTVVYSKKKSGRSILEAMRRGRMYAQSRGEDIAITLFEMTGSHGSTKAISGGTLEGVGPYRLKLNVLTSPGSSQRATVEIIRSGKLVESSLYEIPASLEFFDEGPEGHQGYYRVRIYNKTFSIATNPIFIRQL